MAHSHFRRSLLGFNKRDVLYYIEDLCKRFGVDEKVPLSEAEELRDRIAKLAEENKQLRTRLLKFEDKQEPSGDKDSVNYRAKCEELKFQNSKLRAGLSELEEEAANLRFRAEAARIKLAEYEKTITK